MAKINFINSGAVEIIRTMYFRDRYWDDRIHQ